MSVIIRMTGMTWINGMTELNWMTRVTDITRLTEMTKMTLMSGDCDVWNDLSTGNSNDLVD